MATLPQPRYFTRKKQVSVAPGHHLAFAAGQGYYDAAGAPRVPKGSVDPYAAVIGGLPKPLTAQQIRSQASGEISPLVAAVTAQIQAQAKAASGAIGGFTGDAAAKLAALDFAKPYTQGEQAQSSVDAALRQSLAGGGAEDANALTQRLAVINDPAVAAASGALNANAAGNANANLAQGSAALGNLVANAAAAGSYGEKLPGITRLAGLQQLAGVQQGAQKDIADQTTQLEGQLPSLIDQLRQESDQRASAIASARQNQVARQDAFATTDANNATKLAQTRATAAAGVTKAKISAVEKATAAQISQARSDRSYRLQFAKTFGYDPVSNKVTPGFRRQPDGTIAKVSTAKGAGAKTGSVAQVNSFLKSIPQYSTVHTPDPNVTGGSTTTKKVSGYAMQYQQAYKRLRSMGVDDKTAREDLQSVYPRGQGGRAWLTNEEQGVLKKAAGARGEGGYAGLKGEQAKDIVAVNLDPVSHHRFLSPAQYQILRAAGALPPGSFQDTPLGKRFYISEQ